MGFAYHDNAVRFKMESPYPRPATKTYEGLPRLARGTYRIKEYCVTDGQDPDGYIYAGLTVTCGSDGVFSFRVGRHASSKVATWFNDRVPAENTTFNHTAGELNFAFIGELTLYFDGNSVDECRYVFDNIALAQGHSGSSNNWWFGGSRCYYSGNEEVFTRGYSDSFITPFNGLFEFHRGGNAVDEVKCIMRSCLNTTDWMKYLSNTLRLDEIILPGSHDAGMSELSHCNPGSLAAPTTQTQLFIVAAQLDMGSRYFDLRVDYDYNELVTYHRTDQYGCNGQSLKSILDQTVNFLRDNPSEVIVLKFSHIRNFENHNAADTKRRINDFLNAYSSSMYTNSSSQVNLAAVPIGDMRGKMVLVFEYDEYINPTAGRFRYREGTSSGTNVVVYDRYSDTANYDAMKKDQLQKWQQYGGTKKGYLYLLSWTLTSGGASTLSLAEAANGELPDVLGAQMAKGASLPNIAYIDNVDQFTNSCIARHNFMSVRELLEKQNGGA